MANDEHRELYGLVDGDRLAFKVTASVHNDVGDLKILVQLVKKRGSLHGVDPTNMKLLKVPTL